MLETAPGMTMFWLLLTGTAFVTSVVSGILGMAGGLILLSALLWKLEPTVAIPVHGVVQLVSNAARSWFLREHVAWRAVLRFILPLLPAGALGLLLLRWVPADAGRFVIGVFVLLATWAPGAFRLDSLRTNPRLGLPIGGAFVGFFSTLVGATGPLLAPFILALDLGAQGTIATLAACQIAQHFSKVLLFGLAGFGFATYGLAVALLCGAAIAGTATGTRMLRGISKSRFERVVRWVLTLLAFELLLRGLWRLLPALR
ncbi:MAG TPA: sulfite exporter TauE/SafE family protein [Polyangiaceae bacterium]|nr:sulfite exporter TauE/SafE family protein [Polyangiaceae bacterium]